MNFTYTQKTEYRIQNRKFSYVSVFSYMIHRLAPYTHHHHIQQNGYKDGPHYYWWCIAAIIAPNLVEPKFMDPLNSVDQRKKQNRKTTFFYVYVILTDHNRFRKSIQSWWILDRIYWWKIKFYLYALCIFDITKYDFSNEKFPIEKFSPNLIDFNLIIIQIKTLLFRNFFFEEKNMDIISNTTNG